MKTEISIVIIILLLILTSCSKTTTVNSIYEIHYKENPEKANINAKNYSDLVPIPAKKDSVYLIFNVGSFKRNGIVLNNKDTLTFEYAKNNVESGILVRKIQRKNRIKIAILPDESISLKFTPKKKYPFYELSYYNYNKTWYLTYCTYFCGQW